MVARRTTWTTTPMPALELPPKESQIDGYRVLAPLARGGTAAVFLAEDVTTGERVALKLLDPCFRENAELARRLLAERAISERVRHEGLLDVRRTGRGDGGAPYLVMEYLDGESVEALAARGALDRHAAVTIAIRVAAALRALHAAGFAHCDVKPANVIALRGAWPRIKLVDYGVARRLGEPLSAPAGTAGTPAYMAPEQWRGAPGPASDVYSLGCMLYELLVGRPVFTGTLPQLMAAHRHRRPVRPSDLCPDLPPELERVILRALAKDPAQRPTAAELEAELSRTLCVVEPLAAAG